MVTLRLAPVCVVPHDISWSPIVTVPAGPTFAVHPGLRLLMIVAPAEPAKISSLSFGHHCEALKQTLSPLMTQAQTLEKWLREVRGRHPEISLAGLLLEHTQAAFFASNGAGVVMRRAQVAGVLCAASLGQTLVSRGVLLPQDRFLLGNATLLAAFHREGWSCLTGASFDETKRTIEGHAPAPTPHWSVACLGEAVASHVGGEVNPETSPRPPTWPLRFMQRLTPRYPKLIAPRHRVSRMSLSVGLVLLVLLIISIYLGSKQRLKREQEQAFEQFVAPLETQVAQAYALKETNPLEAKRLVKLSAEVFATQKDTYVFTPAFQARLENLTSTLNQATMEIIGISQATSLSPWHDVSLIREGAQGSEAVVADDQVYVLDAQGGFVYGIDVTTKEVQVVAGSADLKASAGLAAQNQRLVVVSQGRLLEVSATQKTTAFLATDGEGGSAIATGLWSGNVYTLDPTTPSIWKYPGLTQGVGQAQSWLKDSSLLDANVIDMAIDGDVWVLDNQGSITRIRQGLRAGFALETLDKPLTSATSLALGQENDWLFVYDSTNDRILEITKAGAFKREYSLDEQLVVQDMAYSDATDQLFLLSDSRLFVVPR